ncbi:hypothetical protein [Wenyingzhuangia sp. IMCC45574]
MIIPGWKKVELDSKTYSNITCQNCKTKGSITIDLSYWYLHFWGVPFCPIRKVATSSCFECGEVLRPRKMPNDLKLNYQNLKTTSKISPWKYSGLIVFLVFVFFIVAEMIKENNNTALYFEKPKIGDVYEYELSPNRFSCFRIIDFKNSTYVVSKNQLMIPDKYKIHLIDKPENYLKEHSSFSKDSLETMYKRELIIKISRKE